MVGLKGLSRVAILPAVALALLVGACGDSSDVSASPRKATLVLDFLPNAVHAGIYRAVAAGYYRDNNIDLKIVQPTSTSDTLKLIDSGKADFGIADGVDVMGQIDAGRDAQAIMAIVQRPLGGVITRTKDGITSPKQLEGRRVGITGVPSDSVILDTVVRSAGGDPAKLNRITIGFNGVQALENGKIKAFVGYYPADGVQAEVDGTPTTTFEFDENGGPRYPGLVAFSTRARIADKGSLIEAFVDATVHGYEDVLRSPEAGLRDLLAENRALQGELTAAQLKVYEPLFQADADRFGVIRAGDVERLSAFLKANGLIKSTITPDRFATDDSRVERR